MSVLAFQTSVTPLRVAGQSAVNEVGESKSFFTLNNQGAAVDSYGDIAVSSITFNTDGGLFSDTQGSWVKFRPVDDVAGGPEIPALAIGTPISSTINGSFVTSRVNFMNAGSADNNLSIFPSTIGTGTGVVFECANPVTTNFVSTNSLTVSSINGNIYKPSAPSGQYVLTGVDTFNAFGVATITLPYGTNLSFVASYGNLFGSNIPNQKAPVILTLSNVNPVQVSGTVSQTFAWMSVGL